MELTKARLARDRASRQLDRLEQMQADEQLFRDQFPYLLDLLDGVRRAIDAGGKGQTFKPWWRDVQVPLREEVRRMRNAELKKLDPVQMRAEWQSLLIRSAEDVAPHPSRRLNVGDTLSLRTWYFTDGALVGQPVLATLRHHLQADLAQILVAAEAMLDEEA